MKVLSIELLSPMDSSNHIRHPAWSHRLTVRTPGFHPGNPGSIPGEITNNTYQPVGYFL